MVRGYWAIIRCILDSLLVERSYSIFVFLLGVVLCSCSRRATTVAHLFDTAKCEKKVFSNASVVLYENTNNNVSIYSFINNISA